MITGIAIGLALGVLAGAGLTAMAMLVSYNEAHRWDHEECIEDRP